MFGERRIISKKGQEYLYFGVFPQSLKEKNVTIKGIDPNKSNIYIGSDDEKYILYKTDDEITENIYINNELVEANKEYFFKIEPIKWNVIEKDSDSAICISEMILSCHRHGDRSDEYFESEIRDYILNDIYEFAFTDDEKKYILPYYYSENKLDNLSMLSYEELDKCNLDNKKNNNIISNYTREKKMTDYAKVIAANSISLIDSYWCISDIESKDCTINVTNEGLFDSINVGCKCGIVLKIWVKLGY